VAGSKTSTITKVEARWNNEIKKHGVGYCDHVPALLSVAAIGSAHLPTEMNLLLKIAELMVRGLI
jgi:hypothetical protein